MDRKILPENPFMTLDTEGVGALVRMGVIGAARQTENEDGNMR